MSFVFERHGGHRDLHVSPHPFPARRSSDRTSVNQVLYAETMLTNGVQMPAARDEHDVMTGFGQLRPVETTDTASPHHCNSHLPSSAPHIYKQAQIGRAHV